MLDFIDEQYDYSTTDSDTVTHHAEFLIPTLT